MEVSTTVLANPHNNQLPQFIVDDLPYAGRVRHVHFKDCSASIAGQARAGRWDYLQAIRCGLFCELGQGQVDFGAVLARLQSIDYKGWIVVEQDVLPAMIAASTSGTPAASAQRNRQFLRRLGV